jgi:hypothetical protein
MPGRLDQADDERQSMRADFNGVYIKWLPSMISLNKNSDKTAVSFALVRSSSFAF